MIRRPAPGSFAFRYTILLWPYTLQGITKWFGVHKIIQEAEYFRCPVSERSFLIWKDICFADDIDFFEDYKLAKQTEKKSKPAPTLLTPETKKPRPSVSRLVQE